MKGTSERIRDCLKEKGIQVFFKGSATVKSLLMSPKDKDLKCKSQCVVYDIKCTDPLCPSRYIGETKRALDERYAEHLKSDNSALKLHQNSCGHPLPNNVDSDNIQIIDKETNIHKRKLLEAMYIRANDPDLNRNVGKIEIPRVYDKLLLSEERGFIL